MQTELQIDWKKKSNGVNLQSVFQFYTKLPKHEPWLIVDYHLLYIHVSKKSSQGSVNVRSKCT